MPPLDFCSGVIGLDVPVSNVARVGVMGGYRKMDGQLAHGAPLDARAWTIGAYAAVEFPMGLYGQVAGAWLGDAKFKQIGRFSAYGQQAIGQTEGDGWEASAEIGWTFPVGGNVSMTPFAALDYGDHNLDGYTESGASVSNLTYSDRSFKKLTASFGGELATQLGALRPAIRGGYAIENESGDKNATVSLASAQHVMGTVMLPLYDTERDTGFAELRTAMQDGPISGYISGRGAWGRGDDDARVSIGASYAF